MFGGLAFLLGGHLSVSASGQGGMLVRVAPADSDALLERAGRGPHADEQPPPDGRLDPRRPRGARRRRGPGALGRAGGRPRAVAAAEGLSRSLAPPEGFEPALPPPEGGALSPELRGLRWGRPYRRPGGGGNRRGARPGGAEIRQAEVGRGRRRAPIPLPGDPRAALRPDRRRPGGPRPTRARSRCPTACPTTVTVERPRQKGHGDYATNVALQLAKQAGHAAARLRRACVAERLRGGRRASPRSRSPGPGFLNITVDAGAQGAGRRTTSSRPGAAYGRSEALAGSRRSTSSSSRPTRPARSPRQHPLGGGRRRARPAARGRRRRGDPGVLLQRPRRPDRPVRRSLLAAAPGEPAPEDGYARRSTSPRSPTQVVAAQPEAPRPARRRGAGGLPGRRRRADVRRDQGRPCTTSASTSTSTSTRTTCTSRGAVDRAIARLARARATSTRRTARSGCAPTKFGDDKDRVHRQVRRRAAPTSPATRPTTSTSGSAASTAASILLGADHHGYVGRLMALCACVRRRPGVNLEMHDRPDGQPAQRRRSRCGWASGPAPSSRSTTWSRRSASTPRATPWSATPLDTNLDIDLDLWTKADQRQPGLLRAVRPRPARLDPAQRRRPRASRPTTTSTRRCSPTRRRATCCGRSPSSRGWSPPRPSCASRTGWRATSRTPPATYHRFYDACRVLPMGDEEPRRSHGARLLLVDATRIVLANGLGLLGVSAPERM